MNAHEFLISKGITSIGQQITAHTVGRYLNEYGKIFTEDLKRRNELLKDALGLALAFVPAESSDKLEQEEVDRIHALVKSATELSADVKPELRSEPVNKNSSKMKTEPNKDE